MALVQPVMGSSSNIFFEGDFSCSWKWGIRNEHKPNIRKKRVMAHFVWYYRLVRTFFFIVHLKCVPYSNVSCLTSLFRSPGIFEVPKLVARMENFRDIRISISQGISVK
jgi:hypothetical protein